MRWLDRSSRISGAIALGLSARAETARHTTDAKKAAVVVRIA
jgi:hypothetical protein